MMNSHGADNTLAPCRISSQIHIPTNPTFSPWKRAEMPRVTQSEQCRDTAESCHPSCLIFPLFPKDLRTPAPCYLLLLPCHQCTPPWEVLLLVAGQGQSIFSLSAHPTDRRGAASPKEGGPGPLLSLKKGIFLKLKSFSEPSAPFPAFQHCPFQHSIPFLQQLSPASSSGWLMSPIINPSGPPQIQLCHHRPLQDLFSILLSLCSKVLFAFQAQRTILGVQTSSKADSALISRGGNAEHLPGHQLWPFAPDVCWPCIPSQLVATCAQVSPQTFVLTETVILEEKDESHLSLSDLLAKKKSLQRPFGSSPFCEG